MISLARQRLPVEAAGYQVQLQAFDAGERSFSSVLLGSWAARTDEVALAHLRVFVLEALAFMGTAAARAARRWVEDGTVERRFRDAVAVEAMYVHVIADGTTFWELSARPLLFPQPVENRSPCGPSTLPRAAARVRSDPPVGR